jgi:hypothetical protein
MIAIDEGYVDSAAPNSEAAKNGRGLVLKGKFLSLSVSEDQTILFGDCEGSGKEPYRCSCDFQRPDAPTHRCNCPSRQFPCKHSLGLMYAFAQGKIFTPATVPEDLQSKREKLQSRVEKKVEEVEKPKTVNKGALAKKIQAQLTGIDLLEKLTSDLVRLGIGNMSAKTAGEIEEQAKQLGNAYLPGAQVALHNYTRLFACEDGRFHDGQSSNPRELVFSEALDQLGRLHTIVKQGRSYLQRRLDDPELAPETETSIAAWLGHAWQLRELKDAGLVENDVELVQLAFNSYDDVARRELVETGVWMTLNTGRIRITQNFRPYKAAKFIKSDDSFFQVAQVKELCTYPGGVNPRIRWEAMLPRPISPRNFQTIRGHGNPDFAAVIKEVKTHLKGPLADKQPIYALNFKRIGQVDGTLVVEDAKGERLVLTDAGMNEEPASCHLLSFLPPACLENQTFVARFVHNLDTRKLQIKPLSIVTPADIIRLTL